MNKPADLTERIQAIELRLAVRRQLVTTRAALIGRRLRSKMASPPVLAGAAAGGFVLFRLLRRIFRGKPRRTSGPSPQTIAKVGLLTRVAEITAIARSLATSWPGSLLRRSFGGATAAGSAEAMAAQAPTPPAPGPISGHIYR